MNGHFTRAKSQAAISVEVARLRALPDLAQEVLREPWTEANNANLYERAKRRLQLEELTAAIQPVNARGVAYRLMAHGLIADKDNFRRVVTLVAKVRAEGRMPFHWITDEGRELWAPNGAKNIAKWLARGTYYRNAWDEAEKQIIVCVEKAGQHGVYLPVAQEYDVPLVATEGFCSLTRKHDLAQMVKAAPRPTIFANLGDHDDSGIDIMTDTHNWVQDLSGKRISSVRIAVLPGHVDRYKLETRMPGEDRPHAGAEARLDKIDPLNVGPVYDEAIGHFDLDALDPNVGRDLLRDFLRQYLSDDKLAAVRQRERRERTEIEKLAGDLAGGAALSERPAMKYSINSEGGRP